MMNLILDNWITIMVIVILIALAYIGLQTRYRSQIAGFLLELVREAEDSYGGGTGPFKKAYVCELVYNMLPDLAKLIVPQKLIGKLVDNAANQLTIYLEGLSKSTKSKLIE